MPQELFSFEDDPVPDAPVVHDRRRDLLEQIKRDMETLRGPYIDDDPCGRKFYEDRIASYREALTE